jgi:D-alanyl-D-alanine carboxypeptidase/D-alanyl-D-alanine-endopeptidase (penicillin-binding protein 4)
MSGMIARRSLLALGIGAVAGTAWADAPLVSLRPVARGQGGPTPPAPVPVADLIAEARLQGKVGFVVADATTGAVFEDTDSGVPHPPASVTKAITALYALDVLGPGHRFATRLIGTGPVVEGVLQGDLILAGGGDPVLGTDQLADMAKALRETGVRSLTGGFTVWAGALPAQQQIDAQQLPHLGYNPAVGGLNLNFNRVYFEWAQSGSGYAVTMDARSDLYRPEVSMARMRVVDRDLPVYTYADAGGVDDWTVARTALGEGGSRWLPVRYPALYAGDVFRTLALAQGITLPETVEVEELAAGTVLVTHESDPLDVLIRDMLKFSTNLTAEALGLTATGARGVVVETLTQSAAEMAVWARSALGVDGYFVDHSGLGDAARISAAQMAKALVAAEALGPLRPLLKEIPLLDGNGDALADPPATVVAKTGTLNFVATLAGYEKTKGGADLVFAIFAVDAPARAAALASEEEVPDGARAWNGRVRQLQQQLLQRWGAAYSA